MVDRDNIKALRFCRDRCVIHESFVHGAGRGRPELLDVERRFKDPCDPTLVMETMCLDVINAVIVKRDQGLTTSGVRPWDHSAILRFSETAVRLQIFANLLQSIATNPI